MTEQQENQAPVQQQAAARSRSQNSGVWGLCMIISLLFSLAAGVALIWISIARNDLGYEIRSSTVCSLPMFCTKKQRISACALPIPDKSED